MGKEFARIAGVKHELTFSRPIHTVTRAGAALAFRPRFHSDVRSPRFYRVDTPMSKPSQQWITECRNYYGEVLTGWYAHWCNEWDGLPIDWKSSEFTCCSCYSSPLFKLLRAIRTWRDKKFWEEKERRDRPHRFGPISDLCVNPGCNEEHGTRLPCYGDTTWLQRGCERFEESR